ncbi:MAG: OmpH family outer membrane protein [Bacteroidota bacterium]
MKRSIVIRIISCLFLIIVFCAVLAEAQNVKIGYVNSAKILQEYPEAQEAQKKIDAKGQVWQAELETMSNTLKSKYEAFQQKQATLTDQAKRDQQQELVELEQKGVEFRTEKFGNSGALAQLTDSLLTPIKKKVMKVIEAIAKKEGLQFVFDRNEQILVLLYGEPKYDYTNLVIDRLKRGESK